jgi:serine protease Do
MINVSLVRLSTRRLILLATVANLGIAAVVIGKSSRSIVPTLSTANATENAQRPMGFADLVEKVKPAVISVRVKMDAGAKMMGCDLPFPPNSQMERFFRRFGSLTAIACPTAVRVGRTTVS